MLSYLFDCLTPYFKKVDIWSSRDQSNIRDFFKMHLMLDELGASIRKADSRQVQKPIKRIKRVAKFIPFRTNWTIVVRRRKNCPATLLL